MEQRHTNISVKLRPGDQTDHLQTDVMHFLNSAKLLHYQHLKYSDYIKYRKEHNNIVCLICDNIQVKYVTS